MKRLMLVIIALAFSASVAADWVKVGETEYYDTFIDRDTVVTNGQLRRFWLIRNFKTQNRVGQSDRFQEEYDCQEETNLEALATGKPFVEGSVLT